MTHTRKFVAFAVATAIFTGAFFAGAPTVQADHAFARWEARQVTFSNRTGVAAWNLATQRAVNVWAGVGANVSITWAEGGIGCDGTDVGIVPVCIDNLRSGWMGVTNFNEGNGQMSTASVRFDARSFTQAQMDTLACHEFGHALGLGHSGNRSSCLTQGSTSTTPDAHDAEALRSLYR